MTNIFPLWLALCDLFYVMPKQANLPRSCPSFFVSLSSQQIPTKKLASAHSHRSSSPDTTTPVHDVLMHLCCTGNRQKLNRCSHHSPAPPCSSVKMNERSWNVFAPCWCAVTMSVFGKAFVYILNNSSLQVF